MTNRKSRSQYHAEMNENKKKKMDRMLNLLIAIVTIFIIIKFVLILNDNNTVEKSMETKEERVEDDIQKEQEQLAKHTGQSENDENMNKTKETNTFNTKQEDANVTKVENDEYVEEIIVDPNWTAIPTQQSGNHVSSYQKGHIDYEEKLQAIRSAVNLAEDNIIYWSVRNNGSPDTAISVISSKDKTEKYRVSIEWIDQEGWKPVKVEKLKKLEGLK